MAAAIMSIILYVLVFTLTCSSSLSEQKNSVIKKNETKSYVGFYITLAIIFFVQLISTRYSIGYIQDTGLFRLWTSFGENYKISEYYTTEHYVDYPPVYLTVLYIVGKIASLFKVYSQSDTYLCFIRFVPILFDALCSIFIFRFAKDKIGDKKAMMLALMSAINPVNIFNSTVWGQVDSVVTLMLVFMLVFLYNRKYVLSTVMFTLCFLTKPQMVIYAPLFGFTVLFDFIDDFKDKEARNKMIKAGVLSVLAGILVLLIVPLPVTGGNYGLLIEKYKSAVGMYQYATVCAANFFGAIGANWVKNTEPFLLLTYKTWGFIFIVAMSLIVGYVSYKSKDRSKIFYLAAFTVSTIYMFAHGMHERYLFSLFLILLIIYILKRDPKVLTVYLLFSMSNFVNCVQTLIKNHEEDFIYADNTLFILNSWVNIFIYAFMVYIFYVAIFKNKGEIPSATIKHKAVAKNSKRKDDFAKKIVELSNKKVEFQKPYEKVPFVKKDYLIMAVITLVYAIFAFYNLGSLKVPEKGWYPETQQESVVLDLGENCDINRIYTYSGWIDRHIESRGIERKLTIEVSEDGENFRKLETILELNKVFSYKVTEIDENARFIKLTPDDDRFYLNEIAFFGETEADKYIPVSVISDNDTAEYLFDEQDKVKYEFSWFDGTYFDEIYHPRTAYENITGRYPYEDTHPPLGKLIIALGVLIFGMNPFGWRFCGTLCGVLMVPLTYMMGKKMFKKSSWATLTSVIFTFDFMHLSQTRIATIDSYTAFFVMAMYYFMYLYISRSFYNEGFKQTLPPLLLSGICFGLGAATKWQGIYAGLGLCVLFFVTLYKRYVEFKEAEKVIKKSGKLNREETEFMKSITENFKPYATKTVICGALFFVVIPFIIYFLSYIPAMNTESTGLSFFFKNQGNMFRYHSTLESTHPYMSSWWSWPLDYRPLYAYNPNRMFIPEGTSMGISSFGNPFVWWLTIPVLIAAICALVSRKGNTELKTMLAGFAAMYLPWVLVSRSSFIYHFFPCVIFVVLMIVYFAKQMYDKNPKIKKYIIAYAALVVILFVMFYPVLTGMPVPTDYVNVLKWLPSWVIG